MKYRLLLSIAVLGLAGCGDSGGNNGSGNGTASSGGGGDVRLAHGEWEVETEFLNVSGDGLPPEMANAMRGRKETRRSCITREQAENPEAQFLTGQQNANCRNSSFTMRGGRVEGNLNCRGGPGEGNAEMTMEIEGTYEPQTYDIRSEMRISGQDPGKARQTINMEVRARGRRVGDCDAGAEGGNSAGNGTGGNRQ